MSNPYLDHPFLSRTGRRKSHIAKSEKEAPMVLKGAMKAVAEDQEQLRRYRRFWRAGVFKLLDGEQGEGVRQLMKVLKELTPESAARLFRVLEHVQWFRDADDDVRFIVLGLIDEAICRMRVRAGLPPIDDSLPGEEPTVFEICRSKLKPEGE